MKEILGNLFLFAGMGWICFHLVMVAIHGRFFIEEGNSIILWSEIVFTGLLALLGIERMVQDIRKRR